MSHKEENPDIQWAIDLLTPGPEHEMNFIVKHQHYIYCGIFGQLTVFFSNLIKKRPGLSGVHQYPIAFVVSQVIAHVLKVDKQKREGFRDAMFKDYIRKHPEDFKEPVKRTYNDLFHPWSPFR